MAKNENEDVNVLATLGITPDASGLLAAQEQYSVLVEQIRAAVQGLKAQTDALLDEAEELVTSSQRDATDVIAKAAETLATKSDEENRLYVFLAIADRLASLSDYYRDEAKALVVHSKNENAESNLDGAREAYVKASALRDFGTTLFGMFQQFGNVPDGVKTTTRNTRAGKSVVLDWPNLPNPDKTDAKKGKRSYTRNLPIVTVDGTEIPHGTTIGTIATRHLSTKDASVTAADVLSEMEKAAGDDYRQTGGGTIINGRKVTWTPWKEVSDSDE